MDRDNHQTKHYSSGYIFDSWKFTRKDFFSPPKPKIMMSSSVCFDGFEILNSTSRKSEFTGRSEQSFEPGAHKLTYLTFTSFKMRFPRSSKIISFIFILGLLKELTPLDAHEKTKKCRKNQRKTEEKNNLDITEIIPCFDRMFSIEYFLNFLQKLFFIIENKSLILNF